MEKRVNLLPFITVDGIPTFADSEILGLYERMELDGTAPVVFSDGEIREAKGFLSAMKSGLNALYVIYVDEEESGIIWLNRFEARFARCHWCLFSNQWGEQSIAIGTETLRIIISIKDQNENFMWDMLMGIVPSSNKRAVEYCEKCGGAISGEIPFASMSEGKSVNGTIIYYTREGEI